VRSLEQIAEMLRSRGLKLTPQRRLIIDILIHDRTHPTVEDIYRKVLESMPEVSRTTVYNTIREMLNLGVVAEVEHLSEGGVRYDAAGEPHHHFFCVRCKALIDVDADGPIRYELDDHITDRLPGCVVFKRQLTLYGLCAGCAEQEERETHVSVSGE